ncbi:MAG: hypothetical protein HQL64_09445 [Magnetococcales bacterium]|nr:hypothetical protein [Magnetococcales bacterium]
MNQSSAETESGLPDSLMEKRAMTLWQNLKQAALTSGALLVALGLTVTLVTVVKIASAGLLPWAGY